ncbi:unnamed protein product [Nippostrongylus brasiliensis]|uniref:Uncharacterized protein n=1 Tax=Nippostrongylus brasiliensis TaxID=27835 RepID=A0A0N4XJG7_NIPBR|nr:unnamed protein product [Nippostrongylus brasiliensis]
MGQWGPADGWPGKGKPGCPRIIARIRIEFNRRTIGDESIASQPRSEIGDTRPPERERLRDRPPMSLRAGRRLPAIAGTAPTSCPSRDLRSSHIRMIPDESLQEKNVRVSANLSVQNAEQPINPNGCMADVLRPLNPFRQQQIHF